MDNQEAFNRVYAHLLKQGKRSSIINDDGDEQCQYRGPGGLMCAVGCLIPDAEYQPSSEGLPASAVAVRTPSLSGVSVGMLNELQDVHDDRIPSDWEGELRRIAEERCLTVPEVG